MGRYNPNKPSILGVELVPIVGQVRSLDIGSEIGYSFTVTGAPYNAVDLFSVATLTPASAIAGQTVFCAVYPLGREDDTGDIRVNRFTVTTAFVTGAVVSGAASATLALADSSDASYVLFDATTDKLRVTLDATTSLPSTARILGVDLLYQAAGTPGFVLEPTIESNTVIYPYGPYMTGPATLEQVADVGSVRFGDVNPWWNSASGPNATSARMPWRSTEMARWSSLGTGGQLYIGIRVNTLPLSGFVKLGYLAINVYWCQESRVAYGGVACGQDLTGNLTFTSTGPGQISVRDPAFLTAPVLTPGDYTITTSLADAGDKYNAGDKFKVGSLFQYAKVSTHPTWEVQKFRRPSGNLPAIPPITSATDYLVSTQVIGGLEPLQFGSASIDYIGLEGGPVYLTTAGTSVFVRQGIHNEAAASDTSYEQVRFYARRFNPSRPGDLTVTVSGSGSATITAAEFEALPELALGDVGVGTGWKQITLPITAVFSSDTTFRNVTFTMTGVATSSAIDQYQVIIIRCLLTNKYETPITAGVTFGSARYDGLMKAPLTYVAPETADQTLPGAVTNATAVVMFSQSLAAPTGTAAATTSMPVSGIGQDCGVPMCIPTSIYGTRLTWSAIAVTGAFDHYEIQREDDLTEWQSIAIVTGHHTTTFTDWEARVGLQSDYRIRSVNVSDFAGPWSSTFSNTLTAPGIGGADTGNSVLIFTSNHGPTGNLAYIMQFDGAPVEDFSFPEAGFVSLQTQYQRNYFSAHHPTERGGEQFSRTVLVQAAAIAAPSLAGFRSLRDLGWTQLPYVCVRDELGNRWYATVQIPGGRVLHNRTAYLADITVTEVTDTAAAVTVP